MSKIAKDKIPRLRESQNQMNLSIFDVNYLGLSHIFIKFLKIGTLKPTSKRFQTGGEKNNQKKPNLRRKQ